MTSGRCAIAPSEGPYAGAREGAIEEGLRGAGEVEGAYPVLLDGSKGAMRLNTTNPLGQKE